MASSQKTYLVKGGEKMSITSRTLLFKFLLTLAASTVAFLREGWTWIIVVAALTFVINYIIGDRVVLPMLGNFVATLGDGGMAALTAYIVGLFSDTFDPTFGALLMFGLLVAIKEYFIHKAMLRSDKVAP